MPATRHDGRLENLLAACGLGVAERVRAASEGAAGLGAGAPAALTSISSFLEGQAVTALAGTLGLSHAATVRLVDRLESGGLVRRERSDDDAREVRLVATAAGKRAARRILNARREAMAVVLAELSPGDETELTRLLELLLSRMPSDRTAGRRICRLCDIDRCGHPDRCPVTAGVDRALRDA